MSNQIILTIMLFFCAMTLSFTITVRHTVNDDNSHPCPCLCYTAPQSLQTAEYQCHNRHPRHCHVILCRSGDLPGFTCCHADILPCMSQLHKHDLYATPNYDYLEFAALPTKTADEIPMSNEYSSNSLSLESFMNVPIASWMPVPTESTVVSSLLSVLSPTTSHLKASFSETASPTPEMATIYFAADNEAKLYVNGYFIRGINDYMKFEGVVLELEKGDVIAIHAKDRGVWYGVIAAIQFRDETFVTGQEGWKAVKEYEIPGIADLWKFKSFFSCDWKIAKMREEILGPQIGKAPDFPYWLGAKYVWADGAQENDGIFLRYVIGGEMC